MDNCLPAGQRMYSPWRSAISCSEIPNAYIEYQNRACGLDFREARASLRASRKQPTAKALPSGEEVAIFTTRGTVLRHNDLLKGDDGRIVQIMAAEEPTYRVV